MKRNLPERLDPGRNGPQRVPASAVAWPFYRAACGLCASQSKTAAGNDGCGPSLQTRVIELALARLVSASQPAEGKLNPAGMFTGRPHSVGISQPLGSSTAPCFGAEVTLPLRHEPCQVEAKPVGTAWTHDSRYRGSFRLLPVIGLLDADQFALAIEKRRA